MDIKDTKEFEKEFSYLEPQPPRYIPTQLDEKDWHWIKDFIIQDRTKLIEEVIERFEEKILSYSQIDDEGHRSVKRYKQGLIDSLEEETAYWQEALSKLKE